MDQIDMLRLFVRVAERESFTAAARDLRIKQSTASKWIAALERSYGLRLVDRTPRATRLTDAGRRFHATATEVLRAMDGLRSARVVGMEGSVSGHLRISVPVVLGRLYIAPAVTTFLEAHPSVTIDLVFGDRYVRLVEDAFDVAIRVGVPVDTAARGRKLADGRRCLVAAPSYVRRREAPRTIRDLARHDCILHGEVQTPAIWRFRRDGGAERPVSVRGRATTNNSEAALALARGGVGVALLAEWLVRADLAAGALVTLLPREEPPPAPIYALTPPGRAASPLARRLIDHLGAALVVLRE